MPRGRSPNRDKAYEIYRQHGGKITNRKIASMLGEDEKVIAVWKSRDRWNAVQQTTESCTTKAKGGQPGNQNAVGHGGTGPPGNKNAVKTGEFEALFFDTLEEDEKQLIGMIQPDKEQLLLQEIKLLTVRERRMLKRIEDLRKAADDSEKKRAQGMTAVKYKTGTEKDKGTDLVEYQGKLGQIQAIEDALTRVQARKQKAIDSLHRYGYDDARLKLEMQKQADPEEAEDDGFLEALAGAAEEDWGSDETRGI